LEGQGDSLAGTVLGDASLLCYHGSESPRRSETMPTPEELKEEERKLRQLRLVVSLTMSTISQTTLSLEEASKMVVATRELALRLFPGKELAFDLIYQPRFRRLLAERFRLH
jgi:hypothetical protein